MDILESTICDECNSQYKSEKSKMSSLRPECANALYGYKKCEHEFKDGQCLKCFWDGSTSAFVKKMKKAK